jgi:RNA polymerase sigma-70 factor (ECF subfamily)
MSDPHDPLPFPPDRLLAEGRALRALARSLVGAEHGDDLVHDGYVAALQQPAHVRRGGAWLAGVVKHLAARWHRSEARRRTRDAAATTARTDALGDALADPARIAAEVETLRAIAAAVHALAEPFRTVVVLRFWHDLPTQEIAAQLGVPQDTARSRLQRGLARLRERLDGERGGRAAWIGALGALVPREPAAAAAAAVVPLAGVTALLMNTKLLVGAAASAVLAAAIAWPSLRPAERRLPALEAPPAPLAANAKAPPAATPARERADAEGAATPPAAAARQWSMPAAAAAALPCSISIRVLDDDERPVDGATVRVWVAHASEALGVQVFDFTKDGPEIAVLRTDALGRATTTIASSGVIARAESAGAMSAEHLVEAAAASEEVVLTVDASFVLTGRVVRPDGAGAVGAVVTATSVGIDTRVLGRAPAPAPVRADDRGAFRFALMRDQQFTVQAELGGASTFANHVTSREGAPHDIVLTFPGAIGVRGVVVDAAGAPVANANVRMWRHSDGDGFAHAEETQYLRCDARGAFAADLRAHARYGLFALSVAGQPPSEVVWIEPSPARPFAEVRLVLPSFVAIDGVVVRPDGSPIANALVHASAGPIEMAATTAPDRRECFTTGGQVHTDAEGAFALRVHPGTDWTIVVTPDPEVRTHTLRREHIAPDTRGLRIVASAAELRGCTIHGTIAVPAGETCPRCTLRLAWLDEGTLVGGVQEQTPTWDGDAFAMPTLPTGRSIAIEVVPGRGSGFAPQSLGPLTTIADGLRLEVRLQPFAEVSVRVVVPQGEPTRALRVGLVPEHHAGDWAPPAEPVGPDGVAHLAGRYPGNNTLLVFASRRGRELLRQPVTLQPGANAEIVVTLPAK